MISKYFRSWKEVVDSSYEALSFSLDLKQGRGRFLLVKDIDYDNTWNLHFENIEYLEENETDQLIDEVLDYIHPGEFISFYRENIYDPGLKVIQKLEYNDGLEDTGMKRKYGDKYFPILKRK